MIQIDITIKIKIIATALLISCDGVRNNRNYVDNNNDEEFEADSITSLSELPIEKLLILRQSLKHESPIEYGDYKRQPSITRKPNDGENAKSDNLDDIIKRTTGWGHEEGYEHYGDDNMLWVKTKGNIQSIFQTTVTVLAFLAFGGYLICLVITTLRGNNQGQVVVQTMTTSTTTRNRKRRHVGRNNTVFATSENEIFDPEFYALCQIADGYTKYHMLTQSYEKV